MFDHISFFSYRIPAPVTPEVIATRSLEHDYFATNFTDNGNVPDNMRHADFLISGSIDSFLRPPITPYALKNLYHMDSFSIFSCDSNFFTDRKDYDSFLIIYTYEGCGTLTYERKTYRLLPGSGFFIDCKKPHLYRSDTAATPGLEVCWKHSVLHFNGPLVQQLFDQYLANGSVCFSQPLNGAYQNSLEQLLTIYGTASPFQDYQAADCISSILTNLLLTTYQQRSDESVVPENLRYLIHYMNQHFSEALSLDYLAKFSGISKYYLSREFKKYTGFSPNDYLIQLRIEQAKYLLSSTTLPANKIAHMVGIHDVNNFTNLFKKKTGKTPGLYRNTH